MISRITLTETLIILDITKTESNNCFIKHWKQKLGSHVSASSFTASNTNRAKLTWLPLEIMPCGHTWQHYPWPWVSLTWLLYLRLWRHGRWFPKFTVRFRPIRKELDSSVYKNVLNRQAYTMPVLVLQFLKLPLFESKTFSIWARSPVRYCSTGLIRCTITIWTTRWWLQSVDVEWATVFNCNIDSLTATRRITKAHLPHDLTIFSFRMGTIQSALMQSSASS